MADVLACSFLQLSGRGGLFQRRSPPAPNPTRIFWSRNHLRPCCPHAGPAFEGTVDYHLPPEQQTVMQQTAAASGKKLGGGTVPAADARQAAAEAALRRAKGGAAEAAVGPSSTSQPAPQQLPQQHYTKGQIVMYRQRDGTWTQAKVGAAPAASSMG